MNTTVNADPAELAKFSELAHRWWDPESEFRPLHQINPLRLGWIDGLARLQDQHVLDVGCGGGILADAMARKGAQVTGIDLSTKALRVAQLHALEASTPHIRYREVSAEALAQEQPESFDIVTCMEMLEHVPDPASVVRACATLVRPGGWVFFSTIHRNPKAFLLPSWAPNTCSSCCHAAPTNTRASSARASSPPSPAPPASRSCRSAGSNTTRSHAATV
jgi:ubiquinone biosynthesis O-methyltransferase